MHTNFFQRIGFLSLFSTFLFTNAQIQQASTANFTLAFDGGGTGTDIVQGVATQANAVYSTGSFEGTMNLGNGISLTLAGGKDIFIARHNANTGAVVWAVRAGGTGEDKGRAVAADAAGNVWVTGVFSGTANFGSTNKTSSGAKDAFIVRLSDVNGSLQVVKTIGGAGEDAGNAISALADGAVVAGEFNQSVVFGSQTLTSAGKTDIFVSRLKLDGNFNWATRAGGSQADVAKATTILTATPASFLIVTGSIGGGAVTFESKTDALNTIKTLNVIVTNANIFLPNTASTNQPIPW